MNQTKILLVDDEADIQDVLLEAFETYGFTNIKAAKCGREAMQLMAHENFDLIISDFLMPEVNGLELFKQIKSTHPDSPRFLMLTGLDGQDLEHQDLEVLHKPFVFADLIEKVENITA